MARRPRATNAEAIREYFASHPDATPSEAIKALGVPPALVRILCSRIRRKRSTAAKPVVEETKSDEIAAAGHLIHVCGGAKGAWKALDTAARVVSTLDEL